MATKRSIDNILVQEIVRDAILRCLPKSSTPSPDSVAETIFNSSAAASIKDEIVRVGKKLWDRQYVDGNGGNISYRIGEDYVICTPTMCSKGDLTPDDLSLVDFDNRRLCGERPHTSEVLLHLEIYKAVPRARAVIHCHPPHATAYAITGLVPPGEIIPEQEVFVGPVAITSYETPGTRAFAETILPHVRKHNTILLGNHGIVCWADSVTHAEWLAEIVDTYCRTIMLAASLGPIVRIAPGKIPSLLQMKKKLGLPDCRMDDEGQQWTTGTFPVTAGDRFGSTNETSGLKASLSSEQIDRLVAKFAADISDLISGKNKGEC